MTKVFVTGGAGYIGSYVVKLLGEKGFDVMAMITFPPEIRIRCCVENWRKAICWTLRE